MVHPRPTASVIYNNQDRIVIVSGGASGIGQAIVNEFADSGATVVIADVQTPSLDEGRKNIRYQFCDTSDESQCQAVIQYTMDEFGGIDVLVNNAAIQPIDSYHPIDQLPTEVWDRMVSVNFRGYHLMAKHALQVMKVQQSGVIINIASGQAHRTARQVGCYGPIKAATIMQTRQWGVEYARQGIRVVSVSPGAINTPMVQASLEAQGGGEALANRHPLGRIGEPQEIAAAVLWLSSDQASFITGTDLEVDGGLGALGAFADPYE